MEKYLNVTSLQYQVFNSFPADYTLNPPTKNSLNPVKTRDFGKIPKGLSRIAKYVPKVTRSIHTGLEKAYNELKDIPLGLRAAVLDSVEKYRINTVSYANGSGVPSSSQGGKKNSLKNELKWVIPTVISQIAVSCLYKAGYDRGMHFINTPDRPESFLDHFLFNLVKTGGLSLGPIRLETLLWVLTWVGPYAARVGYELYKERRGNK